MKSKSLWILLCGALCAGALLCGCGDTTSEPEVIMPSQSPEAAVVVPVDDDVIAVETPYGNLYYQEQWSEYMYTEQTMENDTLTVHFQAQIADVRYPLFRVTIGYAPGDPIAQITDSEGGKHDVFAEVEEQLEHPELSDTDQRLLYAMQEDINFIFEHIQ